MATLSDRVLALVASIGADVKALSASKDLLTPVTDEAALNLIKISLSESSLRPVHITVLGDSISWGVGSDGLTSQATPWDATQETVYRTTAWPVQLAKLLCGFLGQQPTNGWAGASYSSSTNGGGWQYAVTTGTVTQSTTTGPFGAQSNAQRGGSALSQASGVPGAVEWPAAKLGAFTELLVEYYGTDAGVASPVEPQVQVDGVTVYMPTTNTPGGVLNRIRLTGLSDAPHTVKLLNPLISGRTVYTTGIITTRANGVVVNRVASAGATSSDAAAPAYTAIQQQRVIEPAVKPGLTDLLIIALGTNDYGNQIAVATYVANLTNLAAPVLAAGGSVLLFGGPTPRNGTQNAITEAVYDEAARNLAANTDRMAYVNITTMLQGRAMGDSAALFSDTNSVHPARRGHAFYARTLFNILTRPAVWASSTNMVLPVPSSVKGITAGVTTGTTQVLTWPATVGASRYLVERAVSTAPTTWTTVADTDQTTVTATGLTVSTTYLFRVTARNQAGSGAVSPSTTRTTAAS